MVALLEAWRNDVYRMAHRILEDPDDAQDVSQNALLELSIRLGEVRDIDALPSFIRQVVLHQSFDFRRRRATRSVPSMSAEEIGSESEETEIADRLAVWAGLEVLSPAERETIVLDFVAGYKHEDIAQTLNVAVATVRSRLQSAKRHLRRELRSLQEDPYMQLDPIVKQLIDNAFPGSTVESATTDPEMWLPYSQRIIVNLNGEQITVDVRKDVDHRLSAMLPHLKAAGIATPTLVGGPTTAVGATWSLWKTPDGQNLTQWTMDGTYHRFRTATDITLDILDRFEAFTEKARELGVATETLEDRFGRLISYTGPWAEQSLFKDAMEQLAPHVRSTDKRLSYTSYLHFFPNWYRVKEGSLSEVVYPFGQIEDPLLGLSMVWIYDCYPFVHTGFVEQYMVRHGISREEFAVRLGVQALTIVVREAEVTSIREDSNYPKGSYHELLQRALSWLPAS